MSPRCPSTPRGDRFPPGRYLFILKIAPQPMASRVLAPARLPSCPCSCTPFFTLSVERRVSGFGPDGSRRVGPWRRPGHGEMGHTVPIRQNMRTYVVLSPTYTVRFSESCVQTGPPRRSTIRHSCSAYQLGDMTDVRRVITFLRPQFAALFPGQHRVSHSSVVRFS